MSQAVELIRTRSGSRSLPVAPWALGAALLLSLAFTGTASAHAEYKSSDPATDAVLKSAPSVVTVHFYENVNPSGSSLTVYDGQGKVVSTGSGQVSVTDAMTMTVDMQGDSAEVYLVVWKTVSLDDGDPDIGAFNFFVGNAAVPTRGQASPLAAPRDSGVPGWVAALLTLGGLAVGGGGGFVLARRRVG